MLTFMAPSPLKIEEVLPQRLPFFWRMCNMSWFSEAFSYCTYPNPDLCRGAMTAEYAISSAECGFTLWKSFVV